MVYIQRILERWLRPLPKCAYRWRRLFEFWHPPRAWHPSPLLLWAAPSMPECVANVFQGCAIYAGILKSKVSKPPQHSPSRLRSIFSLPFLLLLSPFLFSCPLPFLLSLSPFPFFFFVLLFFLSPFSWPFLLPLSFSPFSFPSSISFPFTNGTQR